MSLSFDNPHVETGDGESALSCWEADGISRTNTDHGRVYVRDNGGTIEAAKDRAFANVVASGADVASGSTLVLAPQGGSGLTIRAVRGDGTIGPTGTGTVVAPLTVWFFFCDESDLFRKDNQLGAMLLSGEVDFLEPMRDTMREFLTRMAAIYPPPPSVPYPNDLVPNVIEEGLAGTPEWYSQYFWGFSARGEFEIVGLQNPGDYRLWFLNQCLALVYSRKARIGDESDPIYSRQLAFQGEADRLWQLVRPWVDVDRDQIADRQPKIKNVRLRRG